MEPREKLDALVRAGQEKREHQRGVASQRAKKRSAPASPSSTEVAMLALSPLYGAWKTSKVIAVVGWVILLIFGSVAVWEWVSPTPDLPPGTRIPEVATLIIAVLLVVLAALPFAVRRRALVAGRNRYQAEERWLEGLPFKVNGYMTIVGHRQWIKTTGKVAYIHSDNDEESTPDILFDVQVHVTHSGERPTQEFMKTVLQGFGKPLAISRFFYPDNKPHSHEHRFWFSGNTDASIVVAAVQRIVRELLVPLHARFPIGAVTFEIKDP